MHPRRRPIYDEIDDGDDAVSVVSTSAFSVLDALSKSERIENGNVTLDWRSLPSKLAAAVPGAPEDLLRKSINRSKESLFLDSSSMLKGNGAVLESTAASIPHEVLADLPSSIGKL
ncbi:hypothetical protein HDV05_000197, partial [Chytridiales sp. JEL 0842]